MFVSFIIGKIGKCEIKNMYKYNDIPIYIKEGKIWESDFFPIEEFKFYKLTFLSKSNTKNYWAILFFDNEKNQLLADNYSSFFPSEDWTENEFYFRGKCKAKFGKLIFRPIKNENEFYIKEIEISEATENDVLKYTEKLATEIPPIEKFEITKNFIPKTIKKLMNGEKIRMVLLGDSIMNDIGNSFFDVLLKRRYPESKIEIITSVKGGTGCLYYEKDNNVKEFVLNYNPDLLIIGGISNGNNVESIRNVIKQVREKSNCEILVMSGAVGIDGDPRVNKNWEFEINDVNSYRYKLREMAREENVEFFDLNGYWGKYIKNCGKPYDFFLRDPVHANEYGKTVLAFILFFYFS